MEKDKFLAERLKKARLNKGITQEKLSRLTGIHAKAIAKYERGVVQPAADNLSKLAESLEISADYFLFPHAEMTGIPQVVDALLYKRFLVLEKLDSADKEAVLNLLDAVIVRKQFRELAESAKPA